MIMRKRLGFVFVCGALLGILAVTSPPLAAGGSSSGYTRTSAPVTPVLSEPLRVLSARARAGGEPTSADTNYVVPNRELDRVIPAGPARLLTGVHVDQSGPGIALAPTPGAVNFQGLSAVGVAPPDADGAVGPNHFVQWINSQIQIYSKTGAILLPSFNGNLIFSPLGGSCANQNNGDPVVIYDTLADRWQISQFAVTVPAAVSSSASHQCVAVSQTNDPTLSWYLYDFPSTISAPDDFVDYPKMSTWPDAYYMTANVFCTAGTGVCPLPPGIAQFGGVYALERPQMLLGMPARIVSFADPDNVFTGNIINDLEGLTPPPPGRPAYMFFPKFTNAHGVYTLSTTWGPTPTLTATPLPDMPVTLFAVAPCAGRACVPQPAPAADPGDRLESLRTRFMFRAAYRNLGVSESILLNHTVAGAGLVRAVPRWYEVRVETGTPTLFQSGTYAPDTTNRFMGSLAMDASGNIALGYSRSARNAVAGATVNVIPELDVAGRLPGDPLGTLSPEVLVQAGGGIQNAALLRWGDYSQMTVDPRDGCTFWYTGEYLPGNGNFNWTTRIATTTYAPGNCSPQAQGTLAGTITFAESGTPALNTLVSAGPYSAASAATGAYSLTALTGGYTASAANLVNGCTVSTPPSAGVTITNGGTTTQDFTVDGNAILATGAVSVDDSIGNNNGVINKNECFRVTVPIRNAGCHSASAISAVLTTSTPGVTIKTGTSTYPNASIGQTVSQATTFEVSTSPGFVCATPIAFALAITGSTGSAIRTFSLPTCGGGTNQIFSGSLTFADPTEAGRLGRNSAPSGCYPKPCPGDNTVPANSPRNFKKFSFVNPAPVPVCFLVTGAESTCDNGPDQIIFSAYSPSLNPANNQICAGFIGDSATVGQPAPFNFVVPANATFDIVVTAAAGIVAGVSPNCSAFSGVVSGFPDLVTDGGRPTAAATGDATVCAGQPTPLTGGGGTSCSWSPVTGLDDPSSCTPIATPLTTTTYSLTVATAGCTSGNTSQVTVTVTPDAVEPTVTAPADATVLQTLCQ